MCFNCNFNAYRYIVFLFRRIHVTVKDFLLPCKRREREFRFHNGTDTVWLELGIYKRKGCHHRPVARLSHLPSRVSILSSHTQEDGQVVGICCFDRDDVTNY